MASGLQGREPDRSGEARRCVLRVDGDATDEFVGAGETLAETLRRLGHRDVKLGCERGECGACTVLLGDRAVHACTTLTALVSDPVTTPAGAADESADLRHELATRGGFQCGFCTPGQVMAALAVLRTHRGTITADEVRAGLNGNLCRCTGYTPILDAVVAAADTRDRL